MNKRIKIIISIVISFVLLFGVCFFAVYKSDFLYIGFEYFARMGRNYRPEEADLADVSMVELSLDALTELGDVVLDDSLLLINNKYTVNDLPAPDLVLVGDKKVHSCILDAFTVFDQHILSLYGQSLRVVSAYRSAEHQQDVISTSKDDIAAAVGASEHQYGLGIDVAVDGYGGRSFLKTKVGRYVNDHCHEFGFIIRYPLASSKTTGIAYEPWHIRFVGLPHSEIIYKGGMTLEEYVDFLEIGKYYCYGEYLISRQNINNIHIPKDYISCHVSPDNTGHCIVTIVR